MPKSAARRTAKSRTAPIRIGAAVKILLDTCELITCREDLKPAESQRVRDALDLLQQLPPPLPLPPSPSPPSAFSSCTGSLSPTYEGSGSSTDKRRLYLQFLKQAKEIGDPSMVLVLAVGLGQSKVTRMRDRNRTVLPKKFAKHEDAYRVKEIEELVRKFSADQNDENNHHHNTVVQAPAPLTGDVYELTFLDVRNIVMSNQVRGRFYLTNTYSVESDPFITVPSSRELCIRYATQREQVMWQAA